MEETDHCFGYRVGWKRVVWNEFQCSFEWIQFMDAVNFGKNCRKFVVLVSDIQLVEFAEKV